MARITDHPTELDTEAELPPEPMSFAQTEDEEEN